MSARTAAPGANCDAIADARAAARFCAAREVSVQPTALTFIRKLIAEMRNEATGTHEGADAASLWAEDLDWIVTHMESDMLTARTAMIEAGWLTHEGKVTA